MGCPAFRADTRGVTGEVVTARRTKRAPGRGPGDGGGILPPPAPIKPPKDFSIQPGDAPPKPEENAGVELMTRLNAGLVKVNDAGLRRKSRFCAVSLVVTDA